MKKILYIFLITIICALTITSCTEEEISPSNTDSGMAGGGGGSDPK
jgi:hypothetical protein